MTRINIHLLIIFCVVQFSGSTKKKANILIIGDSISIGYTPFVQKALNNKGSVFHNDGNDKYTGNGLEKLDQWLGDTQWDIIQFNWGLWDLCYRNPESKESGQRDKMIGTLTTDLNSYRNNLESLVIRLEKTGAKLIFVTTTMVPKNEAGRFSDDVDKYNAVALDVMQKHRVQVNDLNCLSRTVHPKYGLGDDNVHYSEKGYSLLSKQIIRYLKENLKTIK